MFGTRLRHVVAPYRFNLKDIHDYPLTAHALIHRRDLVAAFAVVFPHLAQAGVVLAVAAAHGAAWRGRPRDASLQGVQTSPKYKRRVE